MRTVCSDFSGGPTTEGALPSNPAKNSRASACSPLPSSSIRGLIRRIYLYPFERNKTSEFWRESSKNVNYVSFVFFFISFISGWKMRARRAGLSALFPRYPWQGARGGGAPSFLPRHVATAPTTFSCSAPHQGLAPVLMGGARGLKILHLKKGRDDWYKNIKGTHPGAEFPRGVTRIWPESWVHPSRGSLFPRIPEPRSTPHHPTTSGAIHLLREKRGGGCS